MNASAMVAPFGVAVIDTKVNSGVMVAMVLEDLKGVVGSTWFTVFVEVVC